MPSLVSDFLINPVLRQARRLSSSFTPTDPVPPRSDRLPTDIDIINSDAAQKDGISKMEEDDPMGLDDPSEIVRIANDPTMTSDPAGSGVMEQQLPLRTCSPSVTFSDPLSDDDDHVFSLPSSSPMRPATSRSGAGARAIPIHGSSTDVGASLPNSLPSSFFSRSLLPEDDGMGALRRKIREIQSRNISAQEKAQLMHTLLLEGYTRSQIARTRQVRTLQSPSSPPPPPQPSSSALPAPLEPASPPGPLDRFWHMALGETAVEQTFNLSEEDLEPSYVPSEQDLENAGHLGCEHYRRNVKLQCSTCQKWYPCRICHNEAEDHVLPRRDTKFMLCMLCGHPQRASDACIKCGEFAARYFCNVCKLWNDDPDKSIYHCADCGICRVGEGLGKDFVHCKRCGSCIAITMEQSHTCREGAMDCDCPICGEYMFTSHKKVLSMKCGHMIHGACRSEYIKTSYKCPICSKSVENMESQFRRLDKHLEEQPMPPEYAKTRAVILCNDCGAKTTTKYHWGGLRCEVCLSYNTVELQLLHLPKLAETEVNSLANSTTTVSIDELRLPATTSTAADNTSSHRALSHRPGASLGTQTDYFRDNREDSTTSLPARIARSVSPLPMARFLTNTSIGTNISEDEEIFNFWRRGEERRSTASAERPDGHHTGSEHDEEDGEDASSSSSSSSASDDDDDDEECEEENEEEEEEQIALFGHR